MAAKFLSTEWAMNASQAFQSDESLPEALSNVDLLIQFSVSEVPAVSQVEYHILISDSQAEVNIGATNNPDVTLKSDYTTAVAISKGELNIQTAYFAGKIDVSGNLAKLVRYRAAVTQLAELVSQVEVSY